MVFLYDSLKFLIELSIILFEYIGTVILLFTGGKAVYNCIRRSVETRLQLAEGMALALEFKLGGEILRTLMVHDLSELYIVGGIVVLRIAITFLIHWEMQGEIPKRLANKETKNDEDNIH